MKPASPQQIFAAKLRAAEEAYYRKHRKPHEGGFLVPPRDKVYSYLSKKFDIPFAEVSYYFTYSRQCTHEWNEGACSLCPVPQI